MYSIAFEKQWLQQETDKFPTWRVVNDFDHSYSYYVANRNT